MKYILALFCISLFFAPTLFAQKFPIVAWNTESADQVVETQEELDMLKKKYPLQAENMKELLKNRTPEAAKGPFVWCSAVQNRRQVCTYRIENVYDDSIQGIVLRFAFQQQNRVWKLTELKTAWRCAENRGRANAYHAQNCR